MTTPDDLRPRTQRETFVARHAFFSALNGYYHGHVTAGGTDDDRRAQAVRAYPDIPESPPEAPTDWQQLANIVGNIVALAPLTGHVRELHGEFHKVYQEIMLSVLRERAERGVAKPTAGSVSEQQVRFALRQGAKDLAKVVKDGWDRGFFMIGDLDAIVNRLHPPITTTRPRVLPDPHTPKFQWRLANEWQYEWADTGTDHWHFGMPPSEGITRERVKLWADLFERPTEEVEGDDVQG